MSARTEDLFHTLPDDARLLLIRLRSIGDCLLLTSPLRALKREFPRFRITVLAETRSVPCFRGNMDVANTVEVGSRKLTTIGRLLGERFDAVLNLHGGPTSLAYSLAARGPSYGLEDFPYRFLYTGLIPRGTSEGHTVESTMQWFGWLGLGTRQPPPLYYAKQPDAREWVEETVGTEPYVTIHPAAIMETKRWPTSRFREVGRILNEKGWRVVVTAGPGEEEVAREAARDLGSSLLLLGLSIPQLAELIRGAVLYIGNDSGPMHLAAAVGTPCIAIWGSSNADRWHPWHVPHRVVQNPFECNPCAGYRCHVADSPLCIESVTVDQVEDAISSLTGELGNPTPATINLQDNLQ